MKILLTGGAGFIGSHTYVELCNAGHEAVIADNFYNASERVLERLATITGKPVKEAWLYALRKGKAYAVQMEGDVSRETT